MTVQEVGMIMARWQNRGLYQDDTPHEKEIFPEDVPPITFMYRNHRGDIRQRVAIPMLIWFGSTEWHPEDQWILNAWDVDKEAGRSFAIAGIDGWAEEPRRLSDSTEATLDVFRLIDRERRNQDAKWGPQNHSGPEWSTILGEEYGEACQQVLRHHFSAFNSEDHVDSYAKLREELIQVAAVAVAWLEVL